MLAEQDNWMNPLNRIIWYKAFKRRETEVTIRDGRRFRLDYDVPPFVIKTLGQNIKVVHAYMAPMDEQPAWCETNFAPYGFFDMKEVTSFHWIVQTTRDANQLLSSKPDVLEGRGLGVK